MKVDIFNTENKYKTIYVDPPWEEKGGGKIKRGCDRHYNTMKIEEIANLPIKQIADPQRMSFIYVGNKQLS